jgi:hypothetical protein
MKCRSEVSSGESSPSARASHKVRKTHFCLATEGPRARERGAGSFRTARSGGGKQMRYPAPFACIYTASPSPVVRDRSISTMRTWPSSAVAPPDQGRSICAAAAHPPVARVTQYASPVSQRIQFSQLPGTKQPPAAEPDASTSRHHRCNNACASGSGAHKRFGGRAVLAVFAASLGCRAAHPAAATAFPR